MISDALMRRLRKLEAKRRPAGDALFLVYADSDQALAEVLADCGGSVPPDQLAAAPWPYDEPAPRPRWTGVNGLSDRELDALLVHLKSITDDPEPSGPATAAASRMSDAKLNAGIAAGLSRDTREAVRRSALAVTMNDDVLGRIAFGGLRP